MLNDSKEIHLVLSGGAARGIAHIGIIEVLEEAGYRIRSVSGTSMGALVGAVYASGQLEAFKRALFKVSLAEIVKLLDFTFKYPGLIKGDKIMHWLAPYLSSRPIEELPLPYLAMATDLAHKTEVVFDHGDLATAVRASISIPSIFVPVYRDDQILVDGGVLNNIPVDKAPRHDGLPVVAVWVNADVPCDDELRRIMHSHLRRQVSDELHMRDVVINSLHLMMRKISTGILRQNPPDLLISVPYRLAPFYDFLKAKPIYEAGRVIARRALNNALP